VIDVPTPIKKDLPASIAEMLTWLDQHDFTVESESYLPNAFGNYSLVIARWPAAFLIMRDRGSWFVSLAGPWQRSAPKASEETIWFAQKLWRYALEGQPVPTERTAAGPLEDQIEFFQDRLDELEVALKTDDRLFDRLDQIRKAVFRANFPGWS
jgi:hypothetical protein